MAATTIQEQATSPSAALTQQVGANTVQRVREYDLSNLKLELAGHDGSLVTITAQQGQHKMHIRWPSNNVTERVSLQKPTSRVRLAFHTVSNTGSLTPASAPEGLKSISLLITPATTDQLLLLLMGAALQTGKLMIQIAEATSKLPLYIPPDRKGQPPAGQTQPAPGLNMSVSTRGFYATEYLQLYPTPHNQPLDMFNRVIAAVDSSQSVWDWAATFKAVERPADVSAAAIKAVVRALVPTSPRYIDSVSWVADAARGGAAGDGGNEDGDSDGEEEVDFFAMAAGGGETPSQGAAGHAAAGIGAPLPLHSSAAVHNGASTSTYAAPAAAPDYHMQHSGTNMGTNHMGTDGASAAGGIVAACTRPGEWEWHSGLQRPCRLLLPGWASWPPNYMPWLPAVPTSLTILLVRQLSGVLPATGRVSLRLPGPS
jgi:hypothetical protein